MCLAESLAKATGAQQQQSSKRAGVFTQRKLPKANTKANHLEIDRTLIIPIIYRAC